MSTARWVVECLSTGKITEIEISAISPLEAAQLAKVRGNGTGEMASFKVWKEVDIGTGEVLVEHGPVWVLVGETRGLEGAYITKREAEQLESS